MHKITQNASMLNPIKDEPPANEAQQPFILILMINKDGPFKLKTLKIIY